MSHWHNQHCATLDEATRPVRSTDVALRLQRLVAGWRGAERGQPLTALHDECRNAVGPGGRPLLPVRLLLVKDLDTTTLQAALRTLNGVGYNRPLRFRVAPAGRFDSALVPTGPAGAPCNAWLLTVEAGLAVREQMALYGHAIGHLLLNRESQQMSQMPPLDPRDGFAHADSLAELRLLESIRRPLDRRVLEACPILAELLRVRDELPAAVEHTLTELRQRLRRAGWPQHLVDAPYVFTAGRVYVSGGTSVRRRQRLRAAALLRYETSLPIALVQTLRPGEAFQDAAQRLTEYARHRLALPFAYLLDDHGTIHEFDWTAPGESRCMARSALPGRDELWRRWIAALV